MENKERNNKLLELKQKIKEYWIGNNRELDELVELKNQLDLTIVEFDRMFMFYRPNYTGYLSVRDRIVSMFSVMRMCERLNVEWSDEDGTIEELVNEMGGVDNEIKELLWKVEDLVDEINLKNKLMKGECVKMGERDRLVILLTVDKVMRENNVDWGTVESEVDELMEKIGEEESAKIVNVVGKVVDEIKGGYDCDDVDTMII